VVKVKSNIFLDFTGNFETFGSKFRHGIPQEVAAVRTT